MESFGRFLLRTDKYKNRVFVSNPPGAALLIWTNRDSLPYVTGVSIVEKVGNTAETGISTDHLIHVLRRQLNDAIPVLHVQYDDEMQFLIVDGEKLHLQIAAERIGKTFNIELGRNPAKAPNNVAQIVDPFHIWSRDAFDGHSVIKTDIDILFVKTDEATSLELVSTIVEIKRSKKVPVGSWLPYVNPKGLNDITNYLISMSLCNLLKVKFVTVHHDVMDDKAILTGQEKVDYFVYNPDSEPVTPTQATLSEFASNKNRKTVTINKLLGV